MKEFILSLKFIFKPSYWVMNENYNPAIDKIMSKLIDNHDLVIIDSYTAKLGDHTIWIANQPYCCFYFYPKKLSGRPSRLTIEKGIKKLNDAYLKSFE